MDELTQNEQYSQDWQGYYHDLYESQTEAEWDEISN